MKKTLVAMFAAMTLVASGYMAPVFAHGMNKSSNQSMYQDQERSDMGSGSISDLRSMNGSFEVSKLTGKEAKGLDGETVGTIKDFVIDPNGHVFALLSTADGGKTVVVPFESFSSIESDNLLSLNLSKDQLANAPEFNQSLLADRSWGDNIYRYYGIQPSFSDQGLSHQQYGTSGETSDQGMSQDQYGTSGQTSDQGMGQQGQTSQGSTSSYGDTTGDMGGGY